VIVIPQSIKKTFHCNVALEYRTQTWWHHNPYVIYSLLHHCTDSKCMQMQG